MAALPATDRPVVGAEEPLAAQSLILSRRDLQFLLYEWLDVTALTERKRFAEHSRETFDAVLDLAEQLATDYLAPHNRAADLNEPTVTEDGTVRLIPEVGKALDALRESGLVSGGFDEEHGGMQLPSVVGRAVLTWLLAANVGTSAYPLLSMANANLIVTHGTPEQIERFAHPIIDGRWFGTMCLSEPDAGSSLADITTKAVPQADGSYRITGSKMWISGGDHELSENIVHLVLARIEGAPAGTKGISLFIVPRKHVTDDGTVGDRNAVTLVGLNHKMGYRGTVNTLLAFDGATGFLIGEANRGLSLMFTMMNDARIGVGLGATALGYTGYLHALEYARTRTQGRSVIDRDPTKPQIPIIDHPDVRRMLLAQKSYVEGGLALGLYCAKLLDDERTAPTEQEREHAGLLLDTLTPIAKAWPSRWCLTANDLAIQVHGGYGYTREYPVEQFYRDNRLNPIHEGTNGIQAQDLLGRKVIAGGGAGLTVVLDAIDATVARARELGGTPAEHADQLAAASAHLATTTTTVLFTGDPELVVANASAYLDGFGHVILAWLWLEQEIAANGKSEPVHAGKAAAAGYFFRYELPQVYPCLDLVTSLDRTTLDLDTSVL